MGVAGSGKTTTAALLAQELRASLDTVVEAEADDFHSPANVAKMASGTPLTDEDRWPWLDSIHSWLVEQNQAGARAVVTCSALRRTYRDVLRAHDLPLSFVHLDAPYEVLKARMSSRPGHYMPVSLLDSQLATLEVLEPDEPGFVVDVQQSPANVVREIMNRLNI